MGLEAGQRLGAYEIVGPLGAGGMGEVYRARDPRLERDVAIKVLPEGLGQDPERLARFEREARVLANLNHPNVATVHGYEQEGETSARSDAPPRFFLVMELVEGETLADRIGRGPLELEEAIPIFLQIAEGLEAAHEQGIVHRDLKPANVKVSGSAPGSPERVKILDFGLAKALAPEALSGSGSRGAAGGSVSESPTLTYMATMRGEILGTAAYMSPEQARGKAVDRRTDVWAFGCCLYEALAGETVFTGETPTDIIAAVVTRDPDWSRLPATTPPHIRRLLRRCLERDPRRRLRDIGEAWVVLDDGTDADVPQEEAPAPISAAAPSLGRRILLGGALFAAGALAAAVLLATRPEPNRPPTPLRRYTIDLPKGVPVPVFEISTML
ncbi:MAG: serine/threonine-protein kinase, partial [Thermoanaerobaculia bacterium]|nr:serine/threonine-protein kinase [Thermoanaerobaculia bacterium]